ncbi:methionyl-tRNA formyltransferase [Sediminivirga luteola]|uniref:Methionyl-tRNA formyltransferase n=1 Tax=Sediminivirga luteola TaxID=1774748 RepID=A0A8J2TYS6_9MICO|nr:methionyl-tRNA formyltransferase [Sediminivirga luteola]GGA17826.1 methionyl-tRNA formyltransferase [Sediminivirga luteola]
MKIVFAGTPEPAVPSLRALAGSSHQVVSVLTRPDAPLGRKRVLTPSPVKRAALELGIPVLEADRLRGDVLTTLEELAPDLIAVVAYGALAGPRALAIAPWLNLHFSLLPDYRGAAPVQHAVIDGRETTGVTVFRLDSGMDTGPILHQRATPIGPDETAGQLLARLAAEGAGDLLRTVDLLASGGLEEQPQPVTGSHAPKLGSADARLDFGDPAAEVYNRYRGVTPAPGAWTLLAGGEPEPQRRAKLIELMPAPSGSPEVPAGSLLVHDGRVLAGAADGALELRLIAPPGKRAMPAADFLRGRPGARFETGAGSGTGPSAGTGTETQTGDPA